jgi:tetratricopeptide (TPR) repeat protein
VSAAWVALVLAGAAGAPGTGPAPGPTPDPTLDPTLELGGTAAQAQDGARGPEAVRGVPRRADAGQQLLHARERARALWGTRGRERWRRRTEAAEAYRAVRAYFPEARAEGAEAAFRAGELWRAGEADGLARREFEAVLALQPEGPFAPRAALELGHNARRAGEHDRALAHYTAVLADERAPSERRADAALWAGRVHAQMGAHELARRLWEGVAGAADEPLSRIEAFDLLALDLIARGDLEGAAGMLDRARGELAQAARESTERGRRVRAALAAMRAIPELARSVEQRARGVLIDGRADGEGG